MYLLAETFFAIITHYGKIAKVQVPVLNALQIIRLSLIVLLLVSILFFRVFISRWKQSNNDEETPLIGGRERDSNSRRPRYNDYPNYGTMIDSSSPSNRESHTGEESYYQADLDVIAVNIPTWPNNHVLLLI